jgi:hypothetical protein
MTTVFVTPTIGAIIQSQQKVRNGLVPDSQFHNAIIGQANNVAAFRGKDIFSSSGNLGIATPGGAGERVRWRFAFHTGPFCKTVRAKVLMCPVSKFSNSNGYARLKIVDAGTLVTTGTDDFHYSPTIGASVAAANVPDNWGYGEVEVAVSPDTDYYGYVSDFDGGIALSCDVYETQLLPDTTNGYVGPVHVAAQSGIFDNQRQDLAVLGDKMWRRGASQVFNWSTDLDSEARTFVSVAADRNVVDNTSTTVSAATPGFTIDMTGKVTLANSVLNCVIACYGNRGAGTSGNQGVKVKNSAGTVLVNVIGAVAANGWFTSVVQLPATTAKYDLQGYSNSGTFTLYAVSVYEYLT